MIILLPVLTCAICVGLLAGLMRAGAADRLALDFPNDRSLHSRPMPRFGGIGIVAGILTAVLLLRQWQLAAVVLLLAVVSWIDDRGHVPIPVRLSMQFVAAIIWVAFQLPDNWVLCAVAVFALVWMTNLYNFMDGSDGLAGGMALIGFITYGLAAWLAGNIVLALLAFSIAASAAGFLFFNFPPARMFMGDVGSVPLGFLAGAVGLLGWRQGAWSLALPLIVFLPFIIDATATLLARVLRRERFWQAHHDHYYQRLVRLGWSQRRLAFFEYGLMIAAGLSALAIQGSGVATQWLVLGAWAVACLPLMAWVDRLWRRFQRNRGEN